MSGSEVKITIGLHTLRYLAETYNMIKWLSGKVGEKNVREQMEWHLDVLKELLEKIGVVDNGNTKQD